MYQFVASRLMLWFDFVVKVGLEETLFGTLDSWLLALIAEAFAVGAAMLSAALAWVKFIPLALAASV